MTQAEVYSHLLNVCTKKVVPMFTFPTPSDDTKFHEGQRCLTVVANVILGGYDDFPFEVPGACNYHGSKIRESVTMQGFSRCCFIEPSQLPKFWCTWMAIFNWVDTKRKCLKTVLGEPVRKSKVGSWSF